MGDEGWGKKRTLWGGHHAEVKHPEGSSLSSLIRHPASRIPHPGSHQSPTIPRTASTASSTSASVL